MERSNTFSSRIFTRSKLKKQLYIRNLNLEHKAGWGCMWLYGQYFNYVTSAWKIRRYVVVVVVVTVTNLFQPFLHPKSVAHVHIHTTTFNTKLSHCIIVRVLRFRQQLVYFVCVYVNVYTTKHNHIESCYK